MKANQNKINSIKKNLENEDEIHQKFVKIKTAKDFTKEEEESDSYNKKASIKVYQLVAEDTSKVIEKLFQNVHKEERQSLKNEKNSQENKESSKKILKKINLAEHTLPIENTQEQVIDEFDVNYIHNSIYHHYLTFSNRNF